MVRLLVLLLFVLLLSGVGVIVIEGDKQAESNHQFIKRVWHQAEKAGAASYHPRQLEGLPPPVQNYLSSALTPGMPIARRIRLHQHGIFNIGEDKPNWLPLKATSHFSTSPPGMVWDARLSIIPPITLHVIDYYHDGRGGLYAKLFDTLPVLEAMPATELDQGEMMTWLAEAVWFPTVLLPGNRVTWTGIDKQRARATVDDGHQQISLVFHFNNRNEVVRVSSLSRAREVNGRYQMVPWSCHYRDYSRLNGVLVPMEGEVIWHLPKGDLPYMRVRIDQLEYDPQP